MEWYSQQPPPEDLQKIQVSKKELSRLIEMIPIYSRLHYNMGGIRNIYIKNAVYHE